MTPGYFIFTDHVCRECCGRIMERVDGGRAGAWQCACCGATGAGAIEEVCACGLRLKDGRDSRFRCIPNPQRSASFPAEIVVKRVTANESDQMIQLALPLRALAQ